MRKADQRYFDKMTADERRALRVIAKRNKEKMQILKNLEKHSLLGHKKLAILFRNANSQMVVSRNKLDLEPDSNLVSARRLKE